MRLLRFYITVKKREKAIITPIDQPDSIAVVDHPFFGMKSKTLETVSKTMEVLRASRYLTKNISLFL